MLAVIPYPAVGNEVMVLLMEGEIKVIAAVSRPTKTI